MSGKLSERKEMQIRICRKKMEYRFEDILEIRNGRVGKAVGFVGYFFGIR